MLNGAWLKRWLTSVDDEDHDVEGFDPPDESSASPEAPVVRCSACAGVGKVRNPTTPTGYHGPDTCWNCGGTGVLRAQFVITLIDLPTGRVASRDILPGVLTPLFDQQCEGYLDLGAEVAQLAATLGVDRVYQISVGRWVERNLQAPVTRPLCYRSDRVVSQRWQAEYQGAAIARAGQGQPQLLLYSGVDLGAPLDPDEALRELVAAAADLDLELVVDVRADEFGSLRWAVCLAVPGSEIARKVFQAFGSLRQALVETSVATALSKGAHRSALARWSVPDALGARDDITFTWPDLVARLTRLALPGTGAVGVYRRGEWFFSSLEAVPDEKNDLKTILRAKDPAPQPEGDLIPVKPCPRCRGDYGNGCYSCRSMGTEPCGAVVTIADLQGKSKHVNWDPRAAEYATVLVTTAERATASGFPLSSRELLLDEHYSIARQAADFATPPHLLRDLWAGKQLDRALVDGKIGRSATDPVAAYVQAAARRRPGGRCLVLAGSDPEPPIAGIFRSILGLGLTLAIGVRSAPAGRQDPAPTLAEWCIELLPEPAAEFSETTFRPFPTLATAAAKLYADFSRMLRLAMQVGPLQPVPAPRQADAISIDVAEISSCLQTLGARYPDTTIRLSRTGDLWTCCLGSPHWLIASAQTLDGVIDELSHPPLDSEERE